MRFGKIGLLCSLLLFGDSGSTLATGSGTSAQLSVSELIRQEQMLQRQMQQVHEQLLATIETLNRLDTHVSPAAGDLSTVETESTIRTMAWQYPIAYLALAATLENSRPFTQAADQQKQMEITTRTQALREKERLETKVRRLSAKARTISEQIARTSGTPYREGSIAGLNLEKVAGLLAWPVPETREVSSGYGWRELNGSIEFHGGIDVAAELGNPIRAAADGVVLFAGPAQGFGNWVVIRHEQGLMTVYGHMYRTGILVKPGQKVLQGQLIGRVGADGQSYGPHLHFGVATGIKDGLLETVNPWNFLQK